MTKRVWKLLTLQALNNNGAHLSPVLEIAHFIAVHDDKGVPINSLKVGDMVSLPRSVGVMVGDGVPHVGKGSGVSERHLQILGLRKVGDAFWDVRDGIGAVVGRDLQGCGEDGRSKKREKSSRRYNGVNLCLLGMIPKHR